MIFFELNYGTTQYFEQDTWDKYYFEDINNIYNFIREELENNFDIKENNLLWYMIDKVNDFEENNVYQMDFYNQKDSCTELYIDITVLTMSD